MSAGVVLAVNLHREEIAHMRVKRNLMRLLAITALSLAAVLLAWAGRRRRRAGRRP